MKQIAFKRKGKIVRVDYLDEANNAFYRRVYRVGDIFVKLWEFKTRLIWLSPGAFSYNVAEMRQVGKQDFGIGFARELGRVAN